MNSTGAMPKKINMSHFGLNLGQTAEDSYVYKHLVEFERVNDIICVGYISEESII